MVDQRKSERRKAVEVGVVSSNARDPVFCVLRDSSNVGALIEVEADTDLPNTFRLTVAGIGLDVECTVVRKDEGRIGVRYADRA